MDWKEIREENLHFYLWSSQPSHNTAYSRFYVQRKIKSTKPIVYSDLSLIPSRPWEKKSHSVWQIAFWEIYEFGVEGSQYLESIGIQLPPELAINGPQCYPGFVPKI